MSPVLGFAFDTSNVADQLTACIEIYNRYKAELLTGTLDPEEQVAAMMEEMREQWLRRNRCRGSGSNRRLLRWLIASAKRAFSRI